jgi:hypothetical protein
MLSVASALYGEILLLREELALLGNRVAALHPFYERQFSQTDQFAITPSNPLLYPALSDKLGILPSELLLGITQFYARVEGARRGFVTYCQSQTESVQYEATIVLEDAVRGVEDVGPMLREIERIASIPDAAAVPDISLAAHALEEFLLQREMRAEQRRQVTADAWAPRARGSDGDRNGGSAEEDAQPASP